MNFDSVALYQRLLELGRKYCELVAIADLWEEGKKVKQSEIFTSLPEMSIAAKEKAIYASEEYKDYLKEYAVRKKASNIAKIEYEGHKILIEMLRTEQSNKRAQMEVEARL